MANKGNTTVIVIVSVLLVGVAGYFIYRGVKSSSDLKKKLGEKKPDGTSTITDAGATSTTTTTTTQDLPVSNVPVGGGQAITSVTAKTQTLLRKTPSGTGVVIKKHVKPTKYDVIQEVKSGIFTFYKVTDGTTEGFIRSDQVIV